MAGMLDLLSQLQVHQAPDPRTQNWGMESFSNALGGLAQQMEQDKERKRLAAERERQLKAEQVKQDREDYKFRKDLLDDALKGNNPQLAGQMYHGLQGAAGKIGINLPTAVGGLRALSNQEAAAMPGNVEDLFSYDAQGNFRPAVQDFNNAQSRALFAGAAGYTPPKPEMYNPNMTYRDPITHEVIQQAAPKVVPNSRYGLVAIDPNNPGAGLSASTPMPGVSPAQGGGPRMVTPPAPVQPRSSGGGSRGGGGGRRSGGGRSSRDRLQRVTLDNGNIGILNLDTQEITDTGKAQYQKPAAGGGGGRGPQPLTETQITDKAVSRVKARPSSRYMSDEEFDAAVKAEVPKVQAEQPKPQQRPAQRPAAKPGAKKGLAASLLKRLEAL